jgi:hypothetical protein
MVLLSMTPAIADVVNDYLSTSGHPDSTEDSTLASPQPGNPISHEQLIRISRCLRTHYGKSSVDRKSKPCSLNDLLKGCTVYRPPPVPKPEPVSQFISSSSQAYDKESPEYQALMASLRADAEARTYADMLPTPNTSNPFAMLTGKGTKSSEETEEESIIREEDSRQVTVIINILVSILCTFFALFFVARNWSDGTRVLLAFFGAIGVGIAEVVVYNGYLRRLSEARREERKKKEVKSLMEGESWVIEGKKPEGKNGARRRKGKDGKIPGLS